ncbi:MAG: hypothetical protein U9R74_10280 [Pseudomonadota bacterium]|nr:hypothetical protein [Pseudomonadota bacterium]
MNDTEKETSLIDVVDQVQLTLDRIQGVAALAGHYAEKEVGDQDLAKSIYLCGGLAKELDEFVSDWWEAQRKKQKKHKKRKHRGAIANQKPSSIDVVPSVKTVPVENKI